MSGRGPSTWATWRGAEVCVFAVLAARCMVPTTRQPHPTYCPNTSWMHVWRNMHGHTDTAAHRHIGNNMGAEKKRERERERERDAHSHTDIEGSRAIHRGKCTQAQTNTRAHKSADQSGRRASRRASGISNINKSCAHMHTCTLAYEPNCHIPTQHTRSAGTSSSELSPTKSFPKIMRAPMLLHACGARPEVVDHAAIPYPLSLSNLQQAKGFRVVSMA